MWKIVRTAVLRDLAHWAPDSDKCPGAGDSNFEDRHTMCPSLPPGKGMMRDPAEHDKDAFRNAYPP